MTGRPVTGDIVGEIVPGGGDWCLVRKDGTFEVEARRRILLSTPRFRTVAPALSRLTRSVFVGHARANADDTTIVYEVLH